MRFGRLFESTKTFVALTILVIAILLYTEAFSYKQIERLKEAANGVTRTLEVDQSVMQLYARYTQMESIELRTLILGDSISEASWEKYKTDTRNAFTELKVLVKDNPGQLGRLSQIETWQDSLFANLRMLDGLNVADSVLLESRGNYLKNIVAVLDSISTIKDAMLQEEQNLLKERRAIYQSQGNITPLVTLLLTLFALVVFIIAFIKIEADKKQLKTSEEFLQNILRSTNNIVNYYEPVYEADGQIKDFKIVFANECNRTYFGMSPEDMKGKLVTRVFPFLLLNGELNKLIYSFEKRESVILDRQIAIKGKRQWFKTVIVPLSKGILISAANFTTEREAEERLRDLNEQLRNQNEALRRSNEEMESFNQVASHDLQEPLRKIQLFTSMVMEADRKNLSLKGTEYLDKVHRAAERMQSLVVNLLAYSKIDDTPEDFETVDLNQILEKVKDDLAVPLKESGAAIEQQPLPKIFGVPFQMEQLFGNIISNALKFRDPGRTPHISITTERLPRESIQEDLKRTCEHYHKICIRDNGVGFSAENADKIFEVFQRLHQKTEYSGTGIGLAICKKIVENHLGIIRATGEEGRGATFTIYLPA